MLRVLLVCDTTVCIHVHVHCVYINIIYTCTSTVCVGNTGADMKEYQVVTSNTTRGLVRPSFIF